MTVQVSGRRRAPLKAFPARQIIPSFLTSFAGSRDGEVLLSLPMILCVQSRLQTLTSVNEEVDPGSSPGQAK